MRDFFFFLCVVFFGIYLIAGSKLSSDMKPQLGKKVVVENDTLTIVDYSVNSASYYLSNGVSVNYNYCKDIIIE